VRAKPRLLIAGGGYAEIPLITAAQGLGFYVISSGNRASDLGHRRADEVRLEDFSDKEAMLRCARELNISAICAGCNDFSAISAAYVAEALGLPGHDPYEVSLTLHHKDRWRRFASENGIASPRAGSFDTVDAALAASGRFDYPVMVKPVDLTGGKGIAKVARADQLRPALDRAFRISRAKRVVVEEFVEGSRHALSMFICEGRVVFYFGDNEHYYRNPYMVSAASTPADVPDRAVKRLCGIAETVVNRLSLETGILHIQYILREQEPIIIELCRRAPGDLYIRFVELATGVDYPAYIVRAEAGMGCGDLHQVAPNGYFARHCVMAAGPGEVRDVAIDATIRPKIIEEMMWWRPGDAIVDYLTQKLGIVFLRFDSMREMLSESDNMQDLIRVEVA
jgi:biotin carboxylase